MNSFNSLNNKQHHPSNESNKGKHNPSNESNKGKHHLSIKPNIEKHNPSIKPSIEKHNLSNESNKGKHHPSTKANNGKHHPSKTSNNGALNNRKPNNGTSTTSNNGTPNTPNNGASTTSNNGTPNTPNNGASTTSNNGTPNTPNNNENITCNSTNESSIGAVNEKFKIFLSLLNSYKNKISKNNNQDKKNNNNTTINNTKVHEIYQAGYCFLNELKMYFQTQITIKNKSKSIKNIMNNIANKDPMQIIPHILKETNDLTQNIEILKDCKDCNKFLSNLFGEGNQQEKADNYIDNINQLNTIFKEVQIEE